MGVRRSTLGVILIIIGALLLSNKILNLNLITMSNFWPVFVLVPGLLFEVSYFESKRNPGLLVPGGILTIIGILFFFETFTNWRFAAYTWPVYPFSVAIGLFQLYLFGYGEKPLLIPIFILGGVSIISFAFIMTRSIFWWINESIIVPVLFILVGIIVLCGGFKSKKVS